MLNVVEHFTYLGSIISNDATVAKDVDNRLAKASNSFGRLQKRVWKSHFLRLSTKILVYKAVVVTIRRPIVDVKPGFCAVNKCMASGTLPPTVPSFHHEHQVARLRDKHRSLGKSQGGICILPIVICTA